MSKATLPLRLARREVRRRPGRTLLVALLIALPVAGMAGAVTLIRTDRVTPEQEWTIRSGTADATFDTGGSEVDAPIEAPHDLPVGSRTLAVASAYPRFRTADHLHRADAQLSDASLADPLTSGMFDLVAGRPPRAAGEVALAPRLARRLGVALGGTLVIDQPSSVRLTVVGLVEQPRCLDCPTALVAPGQPVLTSAVAGHDVRYLIDLPELSSAQARSVARTSAIQLRSDAIRAENRSDGRDEGVRWSLVLGAVALTVMGIVISAAFAVGARRQLVTLGQLSASGASPATLRASLVLQGTITGIVGVTVGMAVAAGSLLALRGRIEGYLGHRFDHYHVHLVDHLGVVALGLGAATLAALIPARTAARLPTLAALAGRRPLSPVSRRLVAGGVAAVVAGLAILGLAVVGSNGQRSGNVWALVAIVGGITELLGACAIAPAFVARLEPLAGRVHGSWRIAARGLARNRARTGAVVSAVAAAGALAIVAASLVRGASAQDRRELEDARSTVVARLVVQHAIPGDPDGAYTTAYTVPDAATVQALDEVLPHAARTTLRSAAIPPHHGDGGWSTAWTANVNRGSRDALGSFPYEDALVADPVVLDTVGLSPAGRRALRRSGVVLLQYAAQPDGELVAPDGTTSVLPVVRAQHSIGHAGNLIITPERAAALHLPVQPSGVLYRNPTDLTAAQRDRAEDIGLDYQYQGTADGASYPDIGFRVPTHGPSPFQLELLLTGLALVFSLFVIGASLALAAAESKDERDILTVAGAPPAALARSAGARAWLLAGIGGLLAVPIGYLPVVVYSRAASSDFPLVFPGRTVALLLLGVPTVVGLVAFATSASAQRLRPVRVSTAAFE